MNERPSDWRDRILEDFRRWIGELVETEAPDGAAQPAAPDLHGLYAELTALRQEIRLQNREQARTGKELAKAAERYDEAVKSVRLQERDLAAFEQRVAREAENRCLRSILDVRDSLARGYGAASEVSNRRGFLLRRPRGIGGIAEGYGIALRRFDRMLAGFGVDRVKTTGRPFDPRTMQATELHQISALDDGVVVEELQSGFLRGEDLLRLAEVAVNRIEGEEHP
ncbi:MAG: nucleotide exchange factor GrpE [Boseongicola sp.]|nr:nucleotide exchange factor GrpE [Boseongicola sp.]